MAKKSTYGKGTKIISVILGALMGGFMWRVRGEGGFGSSWGLFSVGIVLMLLLFHFYGHKKGMRYELIPIGALMLGLGVTGYGTVIEQLAGVVWSDLPYAGEVPAGHEVVMAMPEGDIYASINPWSGAAIIFLMAFTLIPLFSFFVTSLFSGKEYKIKDYAIVILLFFVASTVFKATVSPFILNVINPEQVEYAALGLKEAGFDYSSPFSAYLHHFMDRGWTQEIPFFENYYMSVEHISDTLAVITISLYALIIKKDKVTGFGSLIIDFFEAAASTSLSSLISSNFNYGFFKDADIPAWFRKIADWGVWEYATGFFAGLLIMLFAAIIADKYTPDAGDDYSPALTGKLNIGFNYVLTVFIFGVVPGRALGIRTARLLETFHILSDEEPLGTILTVVLSIIFGIFMIKLTERNMVNCGSNIFGMPPVKFAKTALPAYLIMCFFAYFFLARAVILTVGPKMDITVPLMLITSALIAVIYIPTRIKLKADK